MKLSNSFVIDSPPAQVFDAFLDIERVAGCMPGSRLLGRPAEDTYDGEVKVKVGPLGAAYTGQLHLTEVDRDRLRIALRAKGREQNGAGNADAYVVAQLSEKGEGTLVEIVTELNIRGKVAQFGRGIIGEVTDGFMQAFAKNVEALLNGSGTTPPVAAGPAAAPTHRAPYAPAAQVVTPPEPAGLGSATEAADIPLDAWKFVVRPVLVRHSGTIVAILASALGGYVGARWGTRHGRRHR